MMMIMMMKTDHVENLEKFVLLAAVEAVDYNDESGVVVGKRVHTSCEVTDGLHLLLQHLYQPVHFQCIHLPRDALHLWHKQHTIISQLNNLVLSHTHKREHKLFKKRHQSLHCPFVIYL